MTERFLFFSLCLCVSAVIFTEKITAQIAVRGETIWTMTGEPIQNGVVLIKNGKIQAVGSANQVKIPSDYRVISAKIVTPGLIDAHSVIGLAGYMNQPHDQMQIEASSPMQPELRAIDAYNTEDKLIEWVRSFGVTTVHTGHAPAALVSGQTMIVKTFGKTADEAAIVPMAMIAVTLGENALGSGGKSPGTRAKQAAMLRAELIKAFEAVRKAEGAKPNQSNRTNASSQSNINNQPNNNDNSPNVKNPNSSLNNPPPPNNQNAGNQNSPSIQPVTDLRSEMMQKVARREIPLMVTAHRAQDIMTALRIAKEFNVRIILDGASESHLVMDKIKTSGFPVILHPTMYRAGGETESLSMETASKLKKAGILFAFQSGYETYVPKTRVVLFEAGVAAANGLSMRDALATVTIDAARILGIDRRVGSLEKGKDADLAMYDGDPFEYTTHCTGTIINGRMVSEIIR
ncbi:MAG: amidohydrolase family protein [Acidobacteria bacterium]|nr:amidohydrolase family protein [Acidobacteriota bacterium]MCA1636731.1 amidohydrolase family protein [Acidobacteriota bacterium]